MQFKIKIQNLTIQDESVYCIPHFSTIKNIIHKKKTQTICHFGEPLAVINKRKCLLQFQTKKL